MAAYLCGGCVVCRGAMHCVVCVRVWCCVVCVCWCVRGGCVVGVWCGVDRPIYAHNK